MKRGVLVTLTCALAAGCQDTDLPTPPQQQFPVGLAISDGAHGGNPDFFFLPPIVPNPSGDPAFEASEFNPNLSVRAEICLLDGSGNCGNRTLIGPMTASASDYSIQWHTKTPRLTNKKTYRVFVVTGTSTDLGYRDVKPVKNPQDVPKKPETLAVYVFLNGSTIPLKAHIENGALCDPTAPICASRNFELDDGGTLVLPTDDRLDMPQQPNGGESQITMQLCDPSEELGLDIPTFGDCFKIAADPPVTLAVAATFSVCDLDTPSLSASQRDLVTLHQKRSGGVFALPHADAMCDEPISGVHSNTFTRFASNTWDAIQKRVVSWVGPRSLMADADVLHKGSGGGISTIGSSFQFALPAKMDHLPGTENQVGSVNTAVGVAPGVHVTDLDGNDVEGATVTFVVTGGGGSLVPTSPVVTNPSGIAQVTSWTLGPNVGINTAQASGFGIAVEGNDGPESFFDPFMPTNGGDGPETPVGTGDLTFTATACSAGDGVGTANINGVFGPGEWDCAGSADFTANLSGGSTPATLFWMSDTNNLYLAVRVARSSADNVNNLRFDFDNDGDGTAETKDDVVEFDADDGFADKYLARKCINSNQSGCGKTDDVPHGAGAFSNDGTVSIYEISHPLNSGDAQDFARATGEDLGLFLTLRLGQGAQGNTQWPGFRDYCTITIGQTSTCP